MKLSIEEHTLGTIPVLEVVQENLKHQTLPLIVYYHGWQSQKELTSSPLARKMQRLCSLIKSE